MGGAEERAPVHGVRAGVAGETAAADTAAGNLLRARVGAKF